MTQIRKIPFAKPWITDAERNAILGVLTGDVLNHAPGADNFENKLGHAVPATEHGSSYGIFECR
jgi:perosamine synthetase